MLESFHLRAARGNELGRLVDIDDAWASVRRCCARRSALRWFDGRLPQSPPDPGLSTDSMPEEQNVRTAFMASQSLWL